MMTTLTIIPITLAAVACGFGLVRAAAPRTPIGAMICAGIVVGLAILSWTGYLTALLFGLNALSITVTVVLLLTGVIVLYRIGGLSGITGDLKQLRIERIDLICYLLWSGLLSWMFIRVIRYGDAGMMTAPANNFGDLAFHFSVITSLAYGENLPPQNPVFSGAGFTYPLLIDFLAAFYIRGGAGWKAALLVGNLLLSLSLIGLTSFLTRCVTGSLTAARLAPAIFLFNGGLGFINFFRDLAAFHSDPVQLRQGLMHFMLHLPKAYTMNADLQLWGLSIPLRWGNVFTTMLIPQRSMLFGLPFVAMILACWWMALGERNGTDDLSRRRYLLAAGVLTGMLPMLHAHGFFSVMIAWPLLAATFWSRDWLWFVIPAGLLSAPQALYLSGTQVRDELFKPHLWWESGGSNPIIFWGANAGILLILAITALVSGRLTDRIPKRFYLPFWIWFIVPNSVLLAPWAWDNIKVLVYWSLIMSAPAAVTLVFMIGHRRLIVRVIGGGLLIAATLSGGLDVIRGLSPEENVILFGAREMKVAERIRALTPPKSVILHAPIHNSAVSLTGRRSVMGYPGHLWTHGIDYSAREQEVKTAFQGGAGGLEAMNRLKVDYLLIGPYERAMMQANERFYENLFQVIIEEGDYRLYRIDR
ncbi:MAG: hypothetical protein IPM66_19535 [Acidobacteriota bacterium]|nr:MAG: hypothetical protein IPM66_19535 [Acidobacteriota bacterium]